MSELLAKRWTSLGTVIERLRAGVTKEGEFSPAAAVAVAEIKRRGGLTAGSLGEYIGEELKIEPPSASRISFLVRVGRLLIERSELQDVSDFEKLSMLAKVVSRDPKVLDAKGVLHCGRETLDVRNASRIELRTAIQKLLVRGESYRTRERRQERILRRLRKELQALWSEETPMNSRVSSFQSKVKSMMDELDNDILPNRSKASAPKARDPQNVSAPSSSTDAPVPTREVEKPQALSGGENGASTKEYDIGDYFKMTPS